MALQKQAVAMNFGGGLDTKTDPYQLSFGKFQALQNSVFNTGDRMDKRNGYTALGTTIVNAPSYSSQTYGANVAAGRLIANFKEEEVINDGFNLFSYLSSANGWSYKGRSLLVDQENTSIVKNRANQSNSDSAINSTLGKTVYAYEDSALGVGYSLVDTATGQVVINWNPVSATASRPRCVSLGAKLYIIYFDSSDSKIHVLPFDSSGPGSSAILISNNDTSLPNFDVLVIGSTLYVGYNGASSTVKIASFDTALSPVASVSKSEIASNGIGIFSDASNNIWCAYNNATATKAFIMDSALAVTVLSATTVASSALTTNVQNVTGAYDGTKGIIFWDQPGAPVPGSNVIDGLASGFTQPSIGATVAITTNTTLSQTRVGQTIAIFNTDAGGVFTTVGYYTIVSIASTTLTVRNLGYAGSAAPATVITPLGFGLVLYNVGGFSNASVRFNTLTVGGTAGTAATFQNSAALNSKAFIYNNVAHVVMIHDAVLQPTYFLGSLYNYNSSMNEAAHISAKICESVAGVIPNKSTFASVNQISSGVFQLSLQQRDLLFVSIQGGELNSNSSVATYSQSGVVSIGLDFNLSNPNAIVLGNNLIMGGGIVEMYDGANVVEQGFNLYPECIVYAIYAQTGGVLEASGVYSWKVVYEWMDNQGQVHQSAPSPQFTISNIGMGPPVPYLKIPTLRFTEKTNVNIVVYRTKANGTTFFRLNQPTNPINNDTSVDYVNFIDTYADEAITANQQLYTTGEVENIAPPASKVVFPYKNRAIVIPLDNPYGFQYSKQVLFGSPVEFSDLFFQNVGTIGGPIVGGITMDDKMLLFKSGSIYYVAGTGPSPSGENNDFTDPILITSDAGLVDLPSLVVMPIGVMFKSNKGIYLIDRSLQCSYIGSDVAAYNQYDVTSASLVPGTNQVRFTISNGQVLMFDYFYKQWGLFSNISAVSAVIHDDFYTYLTSSGVVNQESAGYLDGSTPVTMEFTTSWINVAGLQGFERAYFFYLLATYISPHTLTIGIAYDYDPTIVQTTTITPDPSESVEQWRVFLNQQKCESIQLTVTESYDASVGPAAGAGLTLSGLNMLIGIKSNYPRLKASRSVG